MSLAEAFQLSKSAIFSKGREQVCADLIHENESQIAPPSRGRLPSLQYSYYMVVL